MKFFYTSFHQQIILLFSNSPPLLTAQTINAVHQLKPFPRIRGINKYNNNLIRTLKVTQD